MPVTTEKYEATVSAIEGFEGDDEKRGLIEVLCPAIMGDNETPVPVLCEPVPDWGWFYIPDVGEAVEIEFVTTSDRDEIWGQQALEALAPKWRGKRFLTDIEPEGEDPRPIHDDFISTNYGKRRGFATPFGHVLLFDDTDGKQRIYLTHMAKQLEAGKAPEAKDYTRIEIAPDGSLKIGFLNKHQLEFSTEGKLRVALDGEPGSEKHTLEFDASGPSIEVSMDDGNHVLKLEDGEFNVKTKGGTGALKVADDDADAVATIGDGAVHAAIVEENEKFWTGTVKPYIDTHVHTYNQTAVSGGSGAPAVGVPVPTSSTAPTTPAPDWDSAQNSTHLAFPDG